MPVGSDVEEIRKSLAGSGYREIRLRRFQELIGGARYVHLNRHRGFLENSITQLLPGDPVSSWSVWEWQRSFGWFKCSTTRSVMSMALDESYFCDNNANAWFVKPADKIGARPVQKQRFKTGEQILCSFDSFIRRSYGGDESPFDIRPALNERYPPVLVDAAMRQLEQTEELLRTRESEIRHRELFRDVERLNFLADQYRAELDPRERATRERAEALRRAIQNELDTQAQNQRRGIRNSNILENGIPGLDLQRIQNEAMRAIDEILESAPRPTFVGTLPAQPKKAEPVQKPTGRRSIILDEDI